MVITLNEKPPNGTTILSGGITKKHCNEYSTTLGNSVKVWEGDRIIGHIEGNTFTKRVKGSKHQLRKPLAWAISKDAFVNEVLPNTETICIEDTETGRLFECSTETFAEHSFEICRGQYEPQLALGLNHWQVKTNEVSQLSFWGGEG